MDNREVLWGHFGRENIMEKKMQGRYLLGIDQGGTKTAAAVMRGDGFIVGQAVTRGAYFPNEGMESAAAAIQEAAEGR